jgi:hypothetical protein
MGTRSTIALEFADGTVEQVYCHWDGYLSGVGAELQSDYMDPFALRDLIDDGDMRHCPLCGHVEAAKPVEALEGADAFERELAEVVEGGQREWWAK